MKPIFKTLLWPFKQLTRLLVLVIIFVLFRKLDQNRMQKAQFKKRLKYFNPVIKKGAFGSEQIEWQGRPQPLTDTELNNLM